MSTLDVERDISIVNIPCKNSFQALADSDHGLDHCMAIKNKKGEMDKEQGGDDEEEGGDEEDGGDDEEEGDEVEEDDSNTDDENEEEEINLTASTPILNTMCTTCHNARVPNTWYLQCRECWLN